MEKGRKCAESKGAEMDAALTMKRSRVDKPIERGNLELFPQCSLVHALGVSTVNSQKCAVVGCTNCGVACWLALIVGESTFEALWCGNGQ